jgi:siroheme decarboxylase
MAISEVDQQLIAALQRGLPLVSRPYAALGEPLGMSEQDVLTRLAKLRDDGVVLRLGVIVRHHELGYRANAMMVWAIPEERVDDVGHSVAQEAGVTLCYRRHPAPPRWPYNLYCMIHGRDRDTVLAHRDRIVAQQGLDVFPHAVLFSGRRFKQRGARYLPEHTAPLMAREGN